MRRSKNKIYGFPGKLVYRIHPSVVSCQRSREEVAIAPDAANLENS